MSITAAATPLTLEQLALQLFITLLILLPGLVVLWWTRAYRPGSVMGPPRVPNDAALWPVPVAVVLAIFGWFGSAVFYSMAVGMQAAVQQAATQPTGGEVDLAMDMSPANFAFLAAATPMFGLFTAIGFLLLVRPAAVRWIGFTGGRLRSGILLAALAAVFAVPATHFVAALTEMIYQAVNYQHPAEHDLLKFMKESPAPWIKWTAIAAAVLVAPLFEEFLFRGLIQTSLVTWFRRWGQRPLPVMAAAPPAGYGYSVAGYGYSVSAPTGDAGLTPADVGVTPADAAAATPPPLPAAAPTATGGPGANDARQHDNAIPPPPTGPQQATNPPMQPMPIPAIPYMSGGLGFTYPPPDDRRRVWAGWLAIVITSVLFAVIHPLWTAPIIFALSVALGYLYERTGNLWASIGLHAIFNTVSTTLYLLDIGGN